MRFLKRIVALALSVSTMGIAMLSTACNGEEDSSSLGSVQSSSQEEVHTHDWKETIVLTPTCEGKGLKVIKCACGEETYEEIAAGHSLVEYAAQTATCTSVGWDAYVACEKCDYTTKEVQETLPHNYVDGTCSTCGKGSGECVHVWGEYEIISHATCSAAGLQARECAQCGEVDLDIIPAAHTLIYDEGYAPTCTESGYTGGYYCEECDYDETESIPALGHKYVDGVCVNGCAEEKCTITVACQSEMAEQELLESLKIRYEALYPDRKIEIKTFSGAAFETYMLGIAEDQKSSPNIIWTTDTYHSRWEQYFVDLRPYYESSAETDYSLYYETMLDAASTNGYFKPTKNYTNPLGTFSRELDANSDGKENYKNQSEFGLYYAPINYNKPTLLCNLGLFDDLDTDYESCYKQKNGVEAMPEDYVSSTARMESIVAGEDWDELTDLTDFSRTVSERICFIVEYAESLGTKGQKLKTTWEYRTVLDMKLSWEPCYTTVLTAMGVNGITNADGTLNLEAHKGVLETLHGYIEGKNLYYGEDDAAFINNNTFMKVVSRPSMVSALNNLKQQQKDYVDKYNRIPLQAISIPVEKIAATGSGYAISSIWEGKGVTIDGEYKSYTDLSWDFIKFIITEEGQEVAGATGGNIPVLKKLSSAETNGGKTPAWRTVQGLDSMNHDAWVAGEELKQDWFNMYRATDRIRFRNTIVTFFHNFQKSNYGEGSLDGLIARTNSNYAATKPQNYLR